VYICLYNRLRLVVVVVVRLEVVLLVGRSVATQSTRKPGPNRENSKLSFPSPASPLVRNPIKNDALELICDTKFVLIEPSSLVLNGNVKAEIDAKANGGALSHE